MNLSAINRELRAHQAELNVLHAQLNGVRFLGAGATATPVSEDLEFDIGEKDGYSRPLDTYRGTLETNSTFRYYRTTYRVSGDVDSFLRATNARKGDCYFYCVKVVKISDNPEQGSTLGPLCDVDVEFNNCKVTILSFPVRSYRKDWQKP
jgi:hypothetical protein